MSKLIRTLPLCAVFAALLFNHGALADSLRCGSSLVSDGDHPGKVLLECGEPLYKDHRTIYRSGIPNRQPNWRSTQGAIQQYYESQSAQELARHDRSVVEVPVETWVYNFGPSALMKEITFVDGRLTAIKSLGYGK